MIPLKISMDSRPKARGLRAFTLPEVMIAMAIGGTMIGLATLTSVELNKKFAGALATGSAHKEARIAISNISRDLRAATGVTGMNSVNLTINVISSAGPTNVVSYYLQNQNLWRSETPSGGPTVQKQLTSGQTYVTFQYWMKPTVPALTVADTFEVLAMVNMTNSSAFYNSTDYLQTCVLMRNKTYY